MDEIEDLMELSRPNIKLSEILNQEYLDEEDEEESESSN